MAQTYILGKHSTDKMELVNTMIYQSIEAGRGVLLIDPYGNSTDTLLNYIPPNRRDSTRIFDPSWSERSIAFNPLADISEEHVPYISTVLRDAVKEAWGMGGVSTGVMDMILLYSLSALIQANETLMGLPYMLTRREYRQRVLDGVFDPVVADFWRNFDTYTSRDQHALVASTLNKAYAIVFDSRVRHALFSTKSSFSVPDVLNKGQILFVRLPQGKLGKEQSKLWGSIMLSQVHQAALSRDITVPFDIYLLGCHLYAPTIVSEMLNSIFQRNCSLTLVHEYIDQLDDEVFASVLGNCDRKFIYRVSEEDARRLEKHYGTDLMAINFDDLDDNIARKVPFTSQDKYHKTVPLPVSPYKTSKREIMSNHTRNLTRSRSEIEGKVLKFMADLGD